MKSLSYHLILVQSALCVLTDQFEQLREHVEMEKKKQFYFPGRVNNGVDDIPQIGDKPREHSFPEASMNRSKPEKKPILDMVYDKIRRSRKGIAFKQIQKKTGLSTKQIANAIYKLKEKGMVVTLKRGVYVRK